MKLNILLPFLLLAQITFAQYENLYTAVEMLERNPQKAYEIAQTYRVGEEDDDSGYQQYMKLFVLLASNKFTDEEFNNQANDFIKRRVQTLATQVTPRFLGTDMVNFEIVVGKVLLHFDVKLKKAISKHCNTDYYVFRGVVKSISRTGNNYKIELDKAEYQVVAGNSTVGGKEWAAVYNALVKQDWKNVERLTNKYIARYYTDPLGYQAALRYLNIYAVAGLITQNKISKAEGFLKVKNHVGKPIVVPPRIVGDEILNCIQYAGKSEDALFAATTNEELTFIYCLENIYLAEKTDISELEGLEIIISGILQDVELQSDGISAFSLLINEGLVDIQD